MIQKLLGNTALSSFRTAVPNLFSPESWIREGPSPPPPTRYSAKNFHTCFITAYEVIHPVSLRFRICERQLFGGGGVN